MKICRNSSPSIFDWLLYSVIFLVSCFYFDSIFCLWILFCFFCILKINLIFAIVRSQFLYHVSKTRQVFVFFGIICCDCKTTSWFLQPLFLVLFFENCSLFSTKICHIIAVFWVLQLGVIAELGVFATSIISYFLTIVIFSIFWAD